MGEAIESLIKRTMPKPGRPSKNSEDSAELTRGRETREVVAASVGLSALDSIAGIGSIGGRRLLGFATR